MFCIACQEEVHPYKVMTPDFRLIARCPQCQGGLATEDSAPRTTSPMHVSENAPDASTNVHKKRVASRAKARPNSASSWALSTQGGMERALRARLRDIQKELTRIRALEHEKIRLETMLQALGSLSPSAPKTLRKARS